MSLIIATTRDYRGRIVERSYEQQHVLAIRSDGAMLFVSALIEPTSGAERVAMTFGFAKPFALYCDAEGG